MKKYNIIIVENDEDEQFFMKEGFDASGLFNVVGQVKNGDLLMEWLADNEAALPDVILSDLNMPGKNGYDILQEVKGNPLLMRIPVIITSTSSTPTTVNRCMALGATDYLVKPETFIAYKDFAENLYRRIEQQYTEKQAQSGAE
jgi:CheY-like chemotaxis protein